MTTPEDSPTEDARAREEAEVAAAEAAGIGGSVPIDEEDPALRPLAEAGQGESEGFELAEKDLRDIASHGDGHRFPDGMALPPEEEQEAEYGEPDQEVKEDA